MNVTIEQAYEKACTALGEALVRERFQAEEMQRLATEVEALREALREAVAERGGGDKAATD